MDMPRRSQKVVIMDEPDIFLHELPNTIGAIIRLRRRALDMSQAELAKKLKTNQMSVSNYESGKYSLRAEDLPRVAQVLGISPADFFLVPLKPNAKSDTQQEPKMEIIPPDFRVANVGEIHGKSALSGRCIMADDDAEDESYDDELILETLHSLPRQKRQSLIAMIQSFAGALAATSDT